MKAAGNLGYDGSNSRVIRNWPAIDVGEPLPSIPRTALYSGNLGYIHHVPSFVEACDKLRTEGYAITVRGDGPGVARLPAWIHRAPLFSDRASLIESYWRAEVHLIAGHPRFEHAVFPSKAWNSIATGRRIVATGFGPAMQRELEISRNANSREHLSQWADLLTRIEPHRA